MDRLNIITRDIREVIGIDEIKQKISDDVQIKGYWGIEPTTSPTIACLVPLIKMRDLVDAGVSMTILIADLHAFLNNYERIDERTAYYMVLFRNILDTLNLDVKIIRGKDIQLDHRYMLDLYKFMSIVDLSEVKNQRNPKVSSIVYPLMQILDETMLEADIQLGAMDQRKTFMLSRNKIESLGHRLCSYLVFDAVPCLTRYSSMANTSPPHDKIEFTDDEKTIASKLDKMHCKEGESDLGSSPGLFMLKYIVFPLRAVPGYDSFDHFYKLWIGYKISVKDLKDILSSSINHIIKPIREFIQGSPEYAKAYL